MKTLTLEGEQHKFEYLYKNIGVEDKDNDKVPYEVEIRVYVINNENCDFEDHPNNWDKEKFIEEAEKQGRVYTMVGFQEAFNEGEVNTDCDYIRFINIPI